MFDLSSLKAGAQAVPQDKVYDVVIIGGGPAGATAALYAARANLSTVVLDKSVAAGALAVTSKIANYPGIPRVVTGLELLQIMREQAESFGAEFVTAQAVSADLHANPKVVETSVGPFMGKTVIVATGKMGRKNKVAGEDELLGRGVSYCATCDAAFFRDQVAAVVGSNKEAVEESMLLTQFVSKLYLIAPGEKLHVEPEELEQLQSNPKIELLMNRALREVLGEAGVTGVRLATREGEEVLPVDGVFVYLPGNMPMIEFLEGAVDVTEYGCVKVSQDRSTSVPGVYAVGDVVCSYIQQAVVAAADGAIAAMAAEKFIRGRARARSDWA